VVKDDPEAQAKLPEVMKEEMGIAGNGSNQKRSYSTSARRMAQESQQHSEGIDSMDAALVKFNSTMAEGLQYPNAGFGHKFPVPDIAQMRRTDHLKKRYDPVVEQVTKSIMRHGKLSKAQAVSTPKSLLLYTF